MDSPWYVSNQTVHKDLGIHFEYEEIDHLSSSYHRRPRDMKLENDFATGGILQENESREFQDWRGSDQQTSLNN